MTDTSQTETAAGRYEALALEHRVPYLYRGRDNSRLTIPSLLPPEGHNYSMGLYQPFQSVGAGGVNNLANKLATTLFPSTAPFFRLTIDDFVIEALKTESGNDDFAAEVQLALSRFEKAVMKDIEGKADRVAMFEGLKHLLVAGNVLVHDDPDEGLQIFHLDSYVCRRDPAGNPLEIILQQMIAPMLLPEEIRQKVRDSHPTSPGATEESVKLHTWIRRDSEKWLIHQEVEGTIVPKSDGQYPLDMFPWFPLRMIRCAGEHYGRGYVEEYFGDLKSLEGLMKTIVEGSAASGRILGLVDPSGTTRMKTLSKAPNGAFVEGRLEDIDFLKVDKHADFQVALETAKRIEHRLEQAFLMASSIQRQAERVTAEEIRLMAAELEEVMGGVYALMSLEFQQPFIRERMARLALQPSWPSLPKGVVTPTIVTGLEALGRGHDRARLVQYLSTLSQAIGPDKFADVIVLSNLATRLAAMDGIDNDGLIRTDDQIQQIEQQRMMAEQVQKLGPAAIGAASKQQQE